MHKHKTDLLHGLIFIICGVLLLLYTFGLMQRGINALFIGAALVCIGYGIWKSGLYDRLQYLNKKH